MLDLISFFPPSLRREGMHIENKVITITMVAQQNTSLCPICTLPSSRVHSSYSRTLMDLPIIGHRLCLKLYCRKFFCDNTSCKRKIFTERFQELIFPYARRTNRLNKLIEKFAFTMTAMRGSKLLGSMGIIVSHDLLINIARYTPIKLDQNNHKYIAVDDWAIKKGKNYGTIICDHETHRPVAIINGRTHEPFEEWLKLHPEVELVTRDRSSSYAKAIENACPNVIQVADRFHLTHNLLEALKEHIKKDFAAKIAIKLPKDQDDKGSKESLAIQTVTPKEEIKNSANKSKCTSRDKKKELVCAVKTLHKNGMAINTIAKETSLNWRTVRRYIELSEDQASTYKRSPSGSILDRFKEFIVQKLAESQKTTAIFKELKNMGFNGGQSTLRDYVRKLKKDGNTKENHEEIKVTKATRKIAWISRFNLISYLWSYEGDLTNSVTKILQRIFELFPKVKEIHRVVHEFRLMVKNKNPANLESWIEKAIKLDVPEIKTFAEGLQRDWDEVINAFNYSFSNGLAEGHINRLKTIKREMYGRANIDLLSQKALYAI